MTREWVIFQSTISLSDVHITLNLLYVSIILICFIVKCNMRQIRANTPCLWQAVRTEGILPYTVVQKNPRVLKWFPAENICIIKLLAQIPSLWLPRCRWIFCWSQVILKVSKIIKVRISVREPDPVSILGIISLHWAIYNKLPHSHMRSAASTKTDKLSRKVCAYEMFIVASVITHCNEHRWSQWTFLACSVLILGENQWNYRVTYGLFPASQ